MIFDPPSFNAHDTPRSETDQAVIAKLLSQGWTQRPDAPAFDPAKQAAPEWINGAWVVANLSDKQAAQIVYDASVAEGYAVQPEAFILALDDNSRNMFTQGLSLVQLLVSTGAAKLTDGFEIADASLVTHPITMQRYLEIMAAYGVYYYQLWKAAP